jgi:hypothetical protein
MTSQLAAVARYDDSQMVAFLKGGRTLNEYLYVMKDGAKMKVTARWNYWSMA